MSKKIATFKDLDTLASLDTGTSAGYITGATDEQCVTKENFKTVSDKTIEAKGNGLMFVDDSESSKYDSNRLILLDDVQYISEITAVLVSAPNIPASGGSSYATWKLSQSYKVNGDTSPSVIEWQVTGSVVEASSKGTNKSDVTNVAISTVTVTKNGKSISLSQMIKQNLNKIVSYGNWTTPTVTVNPDSFAAAGGTATITISPDPTRQNTWSSGSKSIDTASMSIVSATFGKVSSDLKKLTVYTNTTGVTLLGNVTVKWSFDGYNVKTVESNSYSQIAQTECTMSLTSDTKVYHNTAAIKGKASVVGTIYWGTSSNSMKNAVSVSVVNTDIQITNRDSLGTTTIYAYFVPDSSEYTTLGSSSKYHASASAKITQAYDASITITTSNKTYNGSAQTVVTCDPTGGVHGVSTWALGYATSDSATANSGVTWIEDKTNLSLTNAGTYYIWRRWTADGNHSNSNSGAKIDATVTIYQKAVTVTAGSTSKEYNGSALSYKNATLSGQVSGHTLDSYTCTGSITNVGSTNNVPSAAKIVSGSTDVTANYNITYKNGTLTVTQATPTLKFTASSSTLTYNGSTQNIGTISNTGDGKFYYVVSTSTTVPTTGWTEASSGVTIKSSAATAVTYYVYLKSDAGTNYKAVSATANSGSKAIGKKAVTVTADSATQTYNGSALSKSTFTNTALVSGHVITCSVSGSITNVGSVNNVPSGAKIYTNSNKTTEVTSNYSITYKNGTLTISKATPTLTLAGSNKTYDGKAAYITGTANVPGKIYYNTTSYNGSYTVNLNNQWRLSSTITNPNSSNYEGVYESFSNYNVGNGVATMTITISGYKKFSLYIRSYAESNYDYVMVGQLDKAITGSTSYSSSDVKSHTRGNQQSGTAISNYTLVEFDNMTGGTHTITIVFRKDGTLNDNNDRGYILISKNNEIYSDTLVVNAFANTAVNLYSRTDAGTLTVNTYFEPTDTTNYNSLGSSSNYYASKSITITQATPTLTFNASSSTLTYSGLAQDIGTISYTGDGNFSYVVSTSTTAPSTGWTAASSGTTTTIKSSAATAATYYVYLKSDAGTNYAAASATSKGSKAIGKATPTLTLQGNTNIPYDGDTHYASATSQVAGLIYYGLTSATMSNTKSVSAGGTVELTACGNSTVGQIKVYAYLKPTDTTNYNNSNTVDTTIKITAIASTLTLTGASKTYDGDASYVSATADVAGTIYYGTEEGSKTYSTSVTAGGTVNLTSMGRINAGTTTVYAYLDPTSSNYSNSSNVNAKITISQANGSITFEPADISVQCKNSSTQMTALDVVTCTSATGATGTVTYTLNTGSTTLSNCSLIGTKLTVLKDTPVGEYTISITAKSADTTNYKSASTTSEFTLSVLADTLGDLVGTISISDSSTKLSAGADTRTITWGAVHQTWTHGGENKYPEVTATLTQSCSNNIANTYVTIDNTSYTNNSSTTESTLTKKSYNNFAHTAGAAFTYTLKLGDVVIERLRITAEANTASTTDTGITAYGTPTITIGDGITAAGGSATVTCTVKNTMGTKTVFTSGYTTTGTKEVNGSASWSIASQSCAGGGRRFTKSGNSLVHSTMGTNEGVDTVSLKSVNNGDTTKTNSNGKGVVNYKQHTLTGMNVLYNNALPSNGSTSSPNVTYSTSYVYLSGSSGSTTSGNTLSSIGVGTTFTKTFSIEPNLSGVIPTYASINSSTGVITWTKNPTVLTRSVNILCEGVLTSQGLETNKSVLSLVSQTGQNTSSTIYNTQIQFVNTADLASNLSYEIYVNDSKFYTTRANQPAGALVSGLFDTVLTNIQVRAKNNGNTGIFTLKVTFNGSGGSVEAMRPASGSTQISSSTSIVEDYSLVSFDLRRNSSSNCTGAVQITISRGNIIT